MSNHTLFHYCFVNFVILIFSSLFISLFSSAGELQYESVAVPLPVQTTLTVHLSRLWPNVTIDDTNQSERCFQPFVIDAAGYGLQGEDIVLDAQTTLTLATQPLLGTGLLAPQFVTTTTATGKSIFHFFELHHT